MPLSENGTIRIVGNFRYLNSPGSPGAVAKLLTRFVAMPRHTFWPNDISLLDREKIGSGRLLNSSQVSDSHLVALAIAHGGQLATFDRRVIPDAFETAHLEFI